MRVVRGAVVGVALLLSSCSTDIQADRTERDATGNIVEGGTIGTARLQTGDCFDEPASSPVRTVRGVPCGDPHDGQVVARVRATDAPAWPGEETLTQEAGAVCVDAAASAAAALGDVVGAPVVALAAYVPDAAAWADGDRSVICWLSAAEGEKLFGDLVPDELA